MTFYGLWGVGDGLRALIGVQSSALEEANFVDSTDNIVRETIIKEKRQVGNELCYLPEPLEHGLYFPHRRRCPLGDNSAACRLVPGTPLSVGWVLRYGCQLGYRLNTSRVASICLYRNGKAGWYPALPICIETAYSSHFIPSKNVCGKPARHLRTKRKVDGKVSLLGAWPWMVIFGHNKTSNLRDGIHWFCAGTLVTTRHVLTAANCMANHRHRPVFFARLGDLNLEDNGEDGAEPLNFEIDKKNIIVHPGFQPDIVFSDNIAVVRLKADIRITDFVRPICLPSPDFLYRSFTGSTAYMTSWGQTDDDRERNPKRKRRYDPILHEVSGRVIDHEVCKNNYRSYQTSDTPIIISNKVFCASMGINSSFQGDIGSPLMMKLQENYFLVGIVATDFRYFDELFPRVFTWLASYMEWITTNLEF